MADKEPEDTGESEPQKTEGAPGTAVWRNVSEHFGERISQFGDVLASRITQLGLIATALVGIQTTVTSCSNDNIARHAAFDTAVETEQAFWKERYADYLTAIDATSDDAEKADATFELRRQKLLVVDALAAKPIPSFTEYKLGYFYDQKTAQTRASEYFTHLKTNLHNALWGSKTGGEYLLGDDFDAASADEVRLRDAKGVVIAAPALTEPALAPPVASSSSSSMADAALTALPVASVPALSYETKVFTLGQANGYDLDVFWCVGANEGENYNLATTAAQYLTGEAANASRKGFNVGRIRTRPLPADKQGRGYPQAGEIEIRYDANEATIATALSSQIKAASGLTFTTRESRSATRGYLSLFVCSGSARGGPTS